MPGNKEEAVCTHLPCGNKEQSLDCLDLLENFMIKMEGCNKWVLPKFVSGAVLCECMYAVCEVCGSMCA